MRLATATNSFLCYSTPIPRQDPLLWQGGITCSKGKVEALQRKSRNPTPGTTSIPRTTSYRANQPETSSRRTRPRYITFRMPSTILVIPLNLTAHTLRIKSEVGNCQRISPRGFERRRITKGTTPSTPLPTSHNEILLLPVVRLDQGRATASRNRTGSSCCKKFRRTRRPRRGIRGERIRRHNWTRPYHLPSRDPHLRLRRSK